MDKAADTRHLTSAPALARRSAPLEQMQSAESLEKPAWVKTNSGSPDPAKLQRVHQDLETHTAPYKDSVFDDVEWRRHHSWKRYLPQPCVLWRLLWRLMPVLLWITVISVACGIYQEFRKDDMPDLDNFEPSIVFNLCSFALSLLLVFKTNTCYSRWAEARAAWGGVARSVRNLIRKCQAYVPHMPPRHQKMFMRWVIAMPYVLRSHLLSYLPGTLLIELLLSQEECDWLLTQGHLPLAVVRMLGAFINTLELQQPILLADLHGDLSVYVDQVTLCERLVRTPIPTGYTRHTVRFLFVYLSLLPLAMWGRLDWATVVVAPVVGFLLMGIENIGNQIENPMLVLPMAAYCSRIHIDVEGMMEQWVSGDKKDASCCVASMLNGEIPQWQLQEVTVSLDGSAGAESDGSVDAKKPRSLRRLETIPSMSANHVTQIVLDMSHPLIEDVRDDDDVPCAAMQKQVTRMESQRRHVHTP